MTKAGLITYKQGNSASSYDKEAQTVLNARFSVIFLMITEHMP